MRFILVLLLIALAGAAGWIFGSLHPAPPTLLTPVQDLVADWTNPSAEPATESDPMIVSEPSLEIENQETIPDPIPDPTPASPTPEFEDKDAALAQYRTWIDEARIAHPYPESEERMYDVMMCESGGNAEIVNPAGPYSGLFQYVDGTWNGDWNTYRDQDIYDARAQIFATALAWNLGMQSHWGCYTRAH